MKLPRTSAATGRRMQIRAVLDGHGGPMPMPDVAEEVGQDWDVVRRDLARMVRDGWVTREGAGYRAVAL